MLTASAASCDIRKIIMDESSFKRNRDVNCLSYGLGVYFFLFQRY